MSDTLRTRGSVRSKNDAVEGRAAPAKSAASLAPAAAAAPASNSETATEVKSGEGVSPPEYEDVMEGHRRTVVYGLIDLNAKNNLELQNMMVMAERLKLSRLWTVCAEILEERHRAYVEVEEARRVASLSRPHLNIAVQPEMGPRFVGARTNQRATFLAGSRKRGKIKN